MDFDRLEALTELGWKNAFTQEVLEHPDHLEPCRVIEVQRTGLTVAPSVADQATFVLGGRWYNLTPDERPTVGDWILIDPESQAVEACLTRVSLIKRLSPAGEVQPIAANIDTAFLVTSCNADFSLARIERYLTVLRQEDIQPVVVLTKVDLVDDAENYVSEVQTLGSDIIVEAVNALVPDEVNRLAGWCGPGQSIALLGSSGVGKSTIVNTLSGSIVQETQAAREGDDKGRHTTTSRSLHRLPAGGVILDSPGMREFQIADVDVGVQSVFEDIELLAQECKFNDCGHNSEPGCAVQAAIDAGELEQRRLESYFKLQREDQYNSETIAERHARTRAFSKMVKAHIAGKPKLQR